MVIVSPEIQTLHMMFPNMSLEQIAIVYWDSGNNMQKAANRILGKERSIHFIDFQCSLYS